jgi:hypothetical protein
MFVEYYQQEHELLRKQKDFNFHIEKDKNHLIRTTKIS